MIFSAREIPADTQVEADVCIIGAGAAGITLALELSGSKHDIIVLESGDYTDDGQSQTLLRGEISDPTHHYPLQEARSRLLGGTTAIWGGRCLPLDPIDFERRDYVPFSDWPVSFKEIQEYYPRAHGYCECGEYTYRVDEALPSARENITEYFTDGPTISTRNIERWSRPTHFGKVYLSHLKSAKNLRVLLNATCSHISLLPGDDTIDNVAVRTAPGQPGFRVKARVYILAGGGLEVTRLLLASNDTRADGIGNQSGLLGRFYMGHISGSIARVHFRGDPNLTIYNFERDRDGIYCRRRFWIDPVAQKEHHLLNTVLWLENPPMADVIHQNPILSLAYLALTAPIVGRYLAPEAIRKATTSRGTASNKMKHLLNVMRGLPTAFGYMSGFIYRHYFAQRKLPGFFLPSGSNTYDLHFHAEQIPNPDSRVTLAKRLDTFGLPELIIDYKYAEQDVDSVLRSHDLLKQHMENTNSGTLSLKSPDPGVHALQHSRDGVHQIGTTRMSTSPRNGIVDKDCRVYGTSNLYVASSSVFSTSGQANPTLTIVAFAIRLADLLKRTMPGR
jgi:choline dehydrogenase-like flavoprotein